MTETAKHETLETDPISGIVQSFEQLDLSSLSFIQLRRLHNLLEQASGEIELELQRRSVEDNSGDTVRVPSPNL